MSASERSARRWLALGAATGMVLAIASLLSSSDSASLPDGIVARVNGVPIHQPVYERTVAGLAGDRRSPLTPDDRRHVLDRLIDEELLVQYGQSLGLARSDRRIRGDFVSAVIAAQVASVDGSPPSLAEMEAFYRENRDFFRPPERLRVRSLWIRSDSLRTEAEAVRRAREASERLRAGEDFDAVAAEWGDVEIAPLPDGPLPAAKLREYVGPTALATARSLEVGEISEPIVTAGGVRILLLLAKSVPEDPPLSEVESEVRSEMIRRAGDDALRQLLADLRADGRVDIAEDLP
jgi:parvulin-like peptidyl-prolyl isomerase